MPRVKAPYTIKWTPDPMTYAENILEVDAALATTRDPIAASATEVALDIKERFATKTDPDGTRWEPWSKNYVAYMEQYYIQNIALLRQSDVMYKAVTSKKALIVTNDTLFFDMPTLPPTVTPKGKVRQGSEHRIEYHQEGRASRKGAGDLPQRAFLGMTAETHAFVFATFAEWFNASIRLFTKKAGGVGKAHALQGIHPISGHKGFIPRSTPIVTRAPRR